MRVSRHLFIFITFLFGSLVYSSQILAITDPYEDYLALIEAEKALKDGLKAYPDEVTIFTNDISTTGNVTANDTGYAAASLISSPNGSCGTLTFDSSGTYTYSVGTSLTSDCTERFTYQIEISGKDRHTEQSTLTIRILASEERPLEDFYAVNDIQNITRDINAETSQIIDNVLTNDALGGYSYALEFIYDDDQTQNMGEYGSLLYNSDGSYTYTLFNSLDEIQRLDFNESITDTFNYKITTQGKGGGISTAILTINIFGSQGAVDEFVEIEPNNRSGSGCDSGNCIAALGVATNLNLSSNQGTNVRGHLHNSTDKDWFSIDSDGDEIIHLELCPQGSNCFGEHAWIMYVFDGELLSESIEETAINFMLVGDDTGVEITGLPRYTTVSSQAGAFSAENHMYLDYNFGVFDSSLIGIIDPCYGKTAALDIGVGKAKTYFIAISSPLARGDGTKDSEIGCGADGYGGTVMLLKEGPQHNYVTYVEEEEEYEVLVFDINGDPVLDDDGVQKKETKTRTISVAVDNTETTTQEFITILPNSDDQYTITVKRTGYAPLPTSDTRSARFNLRTNILTIPNLRVGTKIYATDFGLVNETKKSANNTLGFKLVDFSETNEILTANDGSSTFNPETSFLRVPNYLHSDGIIYSLVLYYHPAGENDGHWFELVKAEQVSK
ncbi:MAG: VCBS domain-containing protein [gamma proteobacterium symbiont of Taylorina sp.]|nr:VCBS domain-containing protein [gamma proteobacterium symbiont of Taylorina sp.]